MQSEDITSLNRRLRQRVNSLVQSANGIARVAVAPSVPFDLIATHNEINRRHGTGVILQNIFSDDSRIISVRAQNDYKGEQAFGSFSVCLSDTGLRRVDIFQALLEQFSEFSVRRILCIPFHPGSVMAAIAAKEIFRAPICTYIMDDTNIYVQAVSDQLMAELLEKSDLRLAISPEMRHAYEAKYRRKFWLLPPIVSADAITSRCSSSGAGGRNSRRGALVGNVWGRQWLARLIEAVKESDTSMDWYYNGGTPWFNFTELQLAEAGISLCQPLSEPMLASVLRGYSFALVPSGSLDPNDDHGSIARLSLPSRIPFIVASSNLPIIVMGDPETAAARFVRRFQVGVCCDYAGSSFREAVRSVTDPENAITFRRRAFEIARHFSSEGIAEWIWNSLAAGEPADERFEKLMPTDEREFAYYVKRNPPKDVDPGFTEIYIALARLKELGFHPNFVVDVGASNGVWSHYILRLFPAARFLLVEPLASRYGRENFFFASNPDFEIVEAAISDRSGLMKIYLSPDLFGTSFFPTAVITKREEAVEVKVMTLDELAEEKHISGRGLLKLDVQYAEHLALAGATRFIEQIDAIAIELSLVHLPDGAKSFLEMLNMMDSLGFRYFDDVGEWRLPSSGMLAQKDVLFVRKELLG